MGNSRVSKGMRLIACIGLSVLALGLNALVAGALWSIDQPRPPREPGDTYKCYVADCKRTDTQQQSIYTGYKKFDGSERRTIKVYFCPNHFDRFEATSCDTCGDQESEQEQRYKNTEPTGPGTKAFINVLLSLFIWIAFMGYLEKLTGMESRTVASLTFLMIVISCLAGVSVGRSKFWPVRNQAVTPAVSPPAAFSPPPSSRSTGTTTRVQTDARPLVKPIADAPLPKHVAAGNAITAGHVTDVSLQELDIKRNEWPAELTINELMVFPVLIDGQKHGTIEVPAGMKLKLVEIKGEVVRLAYGEATESLPATSTDLIERVLTARKTPSLQHGRSH